MFCEAAQAPEVVRAQLAANATRVAQLAERLRHSPPRAVVTCARGSSDHAATFARYLIETASMSVPDRSGAASYTELTDGAAEEVSSPRRVSIR